ncbi:MAG: hypothetical protein IK087_07875 [Lachnospiraceae bacterium]|nr:hypothetical protein [Lachnospiraceae bacterium]
MTEIRKTREKSVFPPGRPVRNRKFILQNLLIFLTVTGLWTASLCTGLLSREGPRFPGGSGRDTADSLSDQEQVTALMSQTKEETFAGLLFPVPSHWLEKNSTADAVLYYGDDCALSVSRPGPEAGLPADASITEPDTRELILRHIEDRYQSYAGLDLDSCTWQDRAAVRVHIRDALIPPSDIPVSIDLLLVDTEQGILCLELACRGHEEFGRLLFEEISAGSSLQ